jgi:hypothetical protein
MKEMMKAAKCGSSAQGKFELTREVVKNVSKEDTITLWIFHISQSSTNEYSVKETIEFAEEMMTCNRHQE